jgi:hypothetical protein
MPFLAEAAADVLAAAGTIETEADRAVVLEALAAWVPTAISSPPWRRPTRSAANQTGRRCSPFYAGGYRTTSPTTC